jgi:hypothetical protein
MPAFAANESGITERTSGPARASSVTTPRFDWKVKNRSNRTPVRR